MQRVQVQELLLEGRTQVVSARRFVALHDFFTAIRLLVLESVTVHLVLEQLQILCVDVVVFCLFLLDLRIYI